MIDLVLLRQPELAENTAPLGVFIDALQIGRQAALLSVVRPRPISHGFGSCPGMSCAYAQPDTVAIIDRSADLCWLLLKPAT
jgi:hypothetical protein